MLPSDREQLLFNIQTESSEGAMFPKNILCSISSTAYSYGPNYKYELPPFFFFVATAGGRRLPGAGGGGRAGALALSQLGP